MPSDSPWAEFAYGNGVFVAICFGTAEAATSLDGITWSPRTMPSSQNWVDIKYGNGVFLAIALASNVAATSLDGITWTPRTLPATRDWTSLSYGNGVFVAMAGGASSGAASSPDGAAWTTRTLPSSGDWTGLAYGGGSFLATCFNSTAAATSPDGFTWTAFTLPATQFWNEIAYGDGAFVVVSGSAITGLKIPIASVTTLDASGSGTSSSRLVYQKLTVGGAQSIGPFTNATSVAAAVYRGLDPVNPVPGFSLVSGTGTIVTLPADTTGATSSVVSFAGHQSTNVTFPASQAGVVRRAQQIDAVDAIVVYDSAGVAV
jgi:hypothetical protein